MELKGSKTEANLLAAFAGESQARNKYTYFAQIARKEGYEQIGEIFDESANNEKAHAKIWFKYLRGGTMPTTLEALKEGASGEHFEWSQMYKEFAEVADSEGLTEIANTMRLIGGVEKEHEERFQKLISNIENNKVFSKDKETTWVCLNCGHAMNGKSAPQVCPACKHPQAYFEEKCENY